MSIDTLLNMNANIKALLVFSGCPLNFSEWKSSKIEKQGQYVYQSHGTSDPVLPHFLGIELNEFLSENCKMNVDFSDFSGGHSISPDSLEKLRSLIEDEN